MNIDWPHALVTGLLIAAVIFGLRGMAFYMSAARGKQILITLAALFVVLLVFNLVWPYGGSSGGAG